MLAAIDIAGVGPMNEHVFRTVVAGEGSQAVAGASQGLLYHPARATSDLYTGIILVTPDARLVVLEGANSLATLHRDALALAGLASGQTLLAQPTTFRWFSALLMQRFDRSLPEFTLESLARLCTASPRQLCTYVSTLALQTQDERIERRRVPRGPQPAARAAVQIDASATLELARPDAVSAIHPRNAAA